MSFDELEEDWWDLWRSDPDATPFQSPAWVRAWWAHLGGGPLHVLTVRGDGHLAALLPMFVWTDAGTRKLVPVASGISDYGDALVRPGAGEQVRDRLFAAMAEIGDEYDRVILPDLPAASILLGPAPPGFAAEDTPCATCPVITLKENAAATLPPRQRRKLAMSRNRANRLGDVTIELAAPEELSEALDALFRLHAARWESEGEPGVLADPKVQAFHRVAAPALAEAGLLRLILVRHAGRIVAALYALADQSRLHAYISGVDMSIQGQSFGSLALGHLLDLAISEAKTELHLLRGEEPYKYAWGAQPTQTYTRTLTRF